MIQFNLLPDVKLEYVKAQRTKRLVTSLCLLSSAAALSLMIVLILTVDVWQRKTINDLSGDIKTASDELKAVPDLDKILTVQGQLNVINGLHDSKPAATRVFGFLSQVTPKNATLNEVTLDYVNNTITISGNAPSLDVVNQFTDSLKFTKYTLASSDQSENAFSGVVLSDFSRNSEDAGYTIDATFNSDIFSNTEQVKLKVPSLITTRSVTEQPSILFDQQQTQTDTGQGQ